MYASWVTEKEIFMQHLSKNGEACSLKPCYEEITTPILNSLCYLGLTEARCLSKDDFVSTTNVLQSLLNGSDCEHCVKLGYIGQVQRKFSAQR